MDKEFAFTKKEFNAIRARIRALTGINLADSKDSMVYSRLSRRIRTLRFNSFDQYLKYLDQTESETEQFINALTTNLTSFYREAHHFDSLKQFLVRNPQPLKIWCAACSSGEEAYSIAMTCVEARNSFAPNIEILASDIDSTILSKAKAGIYPTGHVDKLSMTQKKQFFYRGKGSNDGKVKVVPELRKMIEFFQLNLLAPTLAVDDKLDVIFCRNVMIYFDKATQVDIVKKMVKKMTPQGLYFAGHSENFSHLSTILTPIGQTIYRRTGGA